MSQHRPASDANGGAWDRLLLVRDQLIEAAASRGLSQLRVFGSMARGEANEDSDVDLLVHPGPESSLFDLAAFVTEAEELLGVRVDVVSDAATGPVAAAIRAEAIPL